MEEKVWSSDSHPYLTRRPVMDTWYRIRKSDLSIPLLKIHKNNLSIKSCLLNYVTGELPAPTICFEETDEEFLVPFYYGILNFGIDVEDNRNTGNINTSRNLEFRSNLDEEVLQQVSACDAIMEVLNSKVGSGLLALPPGSGKTRCAIYSWIQICKNANGVVPAIVLVHKDFLCGNFALFNLNIFRSMGRKIK